MLNNFWKETLTFKVVDYTDLPHLDWAAVLLNVHGYPELHLPKSEDVRLEGLHHGRVQF